MSKAFTRENDDADSDALPVRADAGAVGRRYMTEDGAKRFRQELAELEERRQGLGERDDEEERRELRRINARKQVIADILSRADVVASGVNPPSEVRFGAFVTIGEHDGGEVEYRLVGVDEVDFIANAISWQSPLAQALMGRREGDIIHFNAPSGDRVLRLVHIRSTSVGGK